MCYIYHAKWIYNYFKKHMDNENITEKYSWNKKLSQWGNKPKFNDE